MNNSQETNYRKSHADKDYGKVYNKTYQQGYYFYQWEQLEKPILNDIFSSLRENGKKTYCDFACGTGRIISFAENYFDRCYGVDVSEEMMKIAKENCKKSTLIHQDITKAPLDVKVDVMTAFRFFLNAENKLKKEALKAIYETLNEQGVLVVNIHVNSNSILGLAYRLRNFLKAKHISNTLSHEELKQILEEAGFMIEETIWYSYWPRVGWRLDFLNKFLLKRLDQIVKTCSFLPRAWSQNFIIIAKKRLKPKI